MSEASEATAGDLGARQRVATAGHHVMTEASARTAMERLEAWLVRVCRVIASFCVLGMLVMAGITLADVLMRWIFSRGITALNEIIEMAFSVAIAACIPAGLATGVNLKIDILAGRMSPRTFAWLHALGSIALLVFYGVLGWRVFVFAQTLAASGRTTLILGWPQAPFIFAVAAVLLFGSFVQAVICWNQVARALALGLRRGAASVQGYWLAWIIVAAGIAAIIAGWRGFDHLAAWTQGHTSLAIGIAFVIMWGLTLALVPIAAVMGLVGLIGAALYTGIMPAFTVAASEVVGFLANSQVATLPLFLMMGAFAATARISEDVYLLAHALLGRFRGGLALATIGGSAGFGALTGNSMATAVTIGKVAVPEMLRRGYSPAFATGCCAAGGTLGALLPPASGPLILFALLSETSIGQLFAAALIPGLIAVALYFITVMLYVRFSPSSAPQVHERAKGEVWTALKRTLPAWILFGSVLGGIYSGIFTPTEAASVGAFEAFLLALFRGKLSGGAFWRVMAETTATTALIYGLIFGAQIFSFLVAFSALTDQVTAFVGALAWPPIAIVAIILVIYLLLGSLMESFAVMVITVPVVTPLILDLGYDIVWWGIINLCVVETGLIHPPLGLNVFVLKSIQPDVPMSTIYKGVAPFVVADLVKLALLVIFPVLATFLVSVMHH
jgi:tripartite ATP-independent transporter DctM subunit